MKRQFIFLAALVSFAMMLTYSCEKSDDPDDEGGGGGEPGVKKVLVKRDDVQAIDASAVTYAFNADKNVEKEVFLDNNNAFVKANVFTYDASQKMISFTTFLDEALTNIESVTNYTFNASAQVTKSVQDAQGAITTTTYTYQSGKLIKASMVYSGSLSLLDEELELEWSGDNVSKMTYKVPDTTGAGGFMVDHYVLFTYDTKINPYYDMKILRLDPVFLSKNNMTKSEGYDANSIKLFLTTVDFKYDGDYPSTADYDVGFQQGKYTYSYKDI